MKNVLITCVVVLVAACGGSNKDNGPECTLLGMACTDSAACCSSNCDPTAGICSRVPGTCAAAGAQCETGPDCCSLACVDNECRGDQCTSDGAACSVDGECCGGSCSNGTCAPLNPTCKTAGNTCGANSECCGGFCKDGLCNVAVSFCTQVGDICTADLECCGGLCQKAMGSALGTCEQVPSSGATGCSGAGSLCGAGASYDGGPLPTCGGECCSRACFPYGPTGALVCQPPSGCRPTGELCTVDQDCCGSEGLPDGERTKVMCRKDPGFTVGRCDNGNACAPAGAICRLQSVQCNATDNCCAGNVQNFDTCHQDSLGIPRCGGAGSTCTFTPGMTCASSADCCGNPCIPSPGSEFGFVCASACVMANGSCTTDADCCSGLPCILEPGASAGVCGSTPGSCSQYGQACDATHPCCNDVPCNGGYCVNILQ